jgi:WD40 repeat protein
MKNNHSQKKGTTAVSEHKTQWVGTCFHGKEDILAEDKATSVSINSTFSLIAVGTAGGTVYVYSVENYNAPPMFSHKLQLMSWKLSTGSVASLAWTSDGHALSVGYESHGLAVWSVYGSMLCATNELDEIANEEK